MTTNETEIVRIPQAGGGVRVVSAQDARHAKRARAILRDDPAMIDHLDGVDGIEISTSDEEA